MINLLSPEDKRNIIAARANIKLLRYCFLLGSAVLFLIGIFAVGYFITISDMQREKNAKIAADTSVAQFEDTRVAAKEFDSNLKIAEKILSSEILYSDLVFDITKTLPSGIVLTDLTINRDLFGKEITINALGNGFDSPARLKNTLEDSPLFSNVSIVTATEVPETNDDISMKLSATLLTIDELNAIRKAE